MKTFPTKRQLKQLRSQLIMLLDEANRMEKAHENDIAQIESGFRNSARNFLHYLAIRQHDIRVLQQDLSSLGLTSLGILEPHTMASIKAVVTIIEQLTGKSYPEIAESAIDFRTGSLLLRDHTRALLGPEPVNRSVRIMVTMPGEAAINAQLVQDLLLAGMDVMRINCAHDGPEQWAAMVKNIRKAERVVGRSCRVQADLAGPKLRTGSISSSGCVTRLKPKRDVFGRVVRPGQVLLLARGKIEPKGQTLKLRLVLDGEVISTAAAGDIIHFTDTRNQSHELRIVQKQKNALVAEIENTAYVENGNVMMLWRKGDLIAEAVVVDVAQVVQPIALLRDDLLVLTRDNIPGENARLGPDNEVIEPAHIHCTLVNAFKYVESGHSVWLDDGKIGGVVQSNNGEKIAIKITHTPPKGAKLRAEKGINFPDTQLNLSALTEKDLIDLEHVVKLVDMVALSFLRGPEDVERLHDELYRLDATHMGVVLKIENKQAFKNLPRILLSSLKSPPVGVMIARGDLAVEVGFERLSEVQQEVLWLCEAAHIPVIWATQVLEGLAKGGAPSRAEVSDAAMSIQAECVMLNKGPNIIETVRFLSGIIGRMDDHYYKHRVTLRKLSVATL